MRQKGLSLLESLATLVIITGVLLFVAQTLMVGAHGTHLVRSRSVVNNLAQQRLEKIRGQGFLVNRDLILRSGQNRVTRTDAMLVHPGSGAVVPLSSGLAQAGSRLFNIREDLTYRANSPLTELDDQIDVVVRVSPNGTSKGPVLVATLSRRL